MSAAENKKCTFFILSIQKATMGYYTFSDKQPTMSRYVVSAHTLQSQRIYIQSTPCKSYYLSHRNHSNKKVA